MKTKYFLASLSLVGLFAACQNEEFVAEQTNSVLKGRPTVNLTLENGADTRLAIGENDVVGYNGADELGAVIVDPANLWAVQQGHVGNNKFYYDANDRKFKTDGTTAIGSWVFYTQYDKAMTTQRNHIAYSFKQIQEGDETSLASTAEGVDFFVSPVIQLDGYEGEELSFAVQTPSIHTRAVIDLKFDAALDVKKVQKIVVAAKEDASDKEFILKGKIKNLELEVADIKKPLPLNKTENTIIAEAAAKMSNAGSYNATSLASEYKDIVEAQAVSGATTKFLALDCISHDENAIAMPVENNEFKSIMMLPAGKYESLTLYIYTDKGIYKKEIKNATPEVEPAAADADFWLRRGHRVNLADITESSNAVTEKLTIKQDNFIDNATATSETEGTVVLKTDDLVEAIKAIDTNGDVEINVMSDDNHKTVINKEVMDALTAVKAIKPNVQLIFSTPMTIEGETAEVPLDLHDISFMEGATLTTGYAVINDDIHIPTSKRLTINDGTVLTFAKAASAGYAYTGIINYGTVNVGSNITIASVENYNVLTITEGSTLSTTTRAINNGIINNNGIWNASGTVQNTIVNNSAATINNFGVINANAKITNSNVINNGKQTESGTTVTAEEKGTINVMAEFVNKGTIYNYKSSVILVKTGLVSTSVLNNEATITNYGDLYCNEGDNTINNTGSIYAKANATTYITTNTNDDESTGTVTNDAATKMGEIFLDARNSDVSVTTDTRKGYISFNVPSTVEKVSAQSGDKFNKVYLNGKCEVESEAVKYIVANAGTDEVTLKNEQYAELTFNTDATIYADPSTKIKVGKLSVVAGVRVKLPTENAMGVYEVIFNLTDKSKTKPEIDNKGTILVGGNFWSSLAQPTTGTFASGDGNTTAFHWSQASWD